MDKIKHLNELWKNVFNIKFWYVIFPFAIIALLLSGIYYIFSTVYMLFDYALKSYKKALLDDNGERAGVQIIKYIFAFFYYMIFTIITIVLSLPLAILYVIIGCSLFVSSAFTYNFNLYKFHDEFKING